MGKESVKNANHANEKQVNAWWVIFFAAKNAKGTK